MNISVKLKQERLANDLTQEEVAEKIGVSRQTISNWENGKTYPDISSIIILCDVYDITLDSLLKGDNEMIKHLKNSTDVTKSNKQLAVSFLLAGVLCAVFILIRIFVPIPQISGVVPSIIAMSVFAVGLIIALAGTINIKKLSEQKTSNKTLLKIGIISLYILIYIPLLLVIPEAVTSGFQIEAEWLQAVLRGAAALILLIPAFVIYKKLSYLFS